MSCENLGSEMKKEQKPLKFLAKILVVIFGLAILVFLVESVVEIFLLLSGSHAAAAFVNQLFFGIFVILFGITGILGVMVSPYRAFIKRKTLLIVTTACFIFIGVGLVELRDKFFDFYPPPIENGWLINEIGSPWEVPLMVLVLVGAMGATLIFLVKSKYFFKPKERFKKTIVVVSTSAVLIFGVFFGIESIKDTLELPVQKKVVIVKKFEDFSAVRYSQLIVNDYVLRSTDGSITFDLEVKKYIYDQVHPPHQADIEIRPRTKKLVKINLVD